MPPVDGALAMASPTGIAEAQVAHRAYELYCARGYQDGYDVDDWLQAERDLRGEEKSSAA
jgi:hypothetical protein